MKKATNIEEVYNAFMPEYALQTSDNDFFVPLFNDSLKKFTTDMILTPDKNKTYFMVGQSGNGKSTSLNMLGTINPKLNNKYDFFYIKGREAFKYIEGIDVADIVFNISYEIINGDDELIKLFAEKLEKLEKTHNKKLEEKLEKINSSQEKVSIKANIGIGANILSFIKAKIDFSSGYSLKDEVRKSAIEFFKFNKSDLFALINEIILEYKLKHNKDIIIIIDDLEKRDDVNTLFLKTAQLDLFNFINAIKIISTPVHLSRNTNIKFGEKKELALKLKDKEGNECEDDREILKKVINKRINNDNYDLIREDAIEEIINKSGANMNQLISLVHKSALNAINNDSDFINIEDVDNAVYEIRQARSSFVLNQISFLNDIAKKRSIDFSDYENIKKLQTATQNEILFSYFNGDTWYDLNPICQKSLDSYNKTYT